MESATKDAKTAIKKSRRVFMALARRNRVGVFKENLLSKIITNDNELLCEGCDLQNTFCEGWKCDWQASVFFEQMKPREYWRKLYYQYFGDKFYNLSRRDKSKLLNP